MRVVLSESCPIPSLIIDTGILFFFAMLAHEWRATYIVMLFWSPTICEILLSFLLVYDRAFKYCLLYSMLLLIIIGNRNSVWLISLYRSTISCIHLSHFIKSCCPVFFLLYDKIPLLRSLFLRYAISMKDIPLV